MLADDIRSGWRCDGSKGRDGTVTTDRRRLRQGIVVVGIALAGLVGLLAAIQVRGAATGCDGAPAGSCMRVLFIGNSYTYVNDLPDTFAALAGSGGHPVQTSMIAPGGAYLADEVGSAAVSDSLAATRWDVVVLQEQSQVVAVPAVRRSRTDPAVATLAGRIRAIGAVPELFMTWAHRDGWPEQGLADYAAMQRGIDDGYLALAREVGLPVAPVGFLWSVVREERPDLALWQADGSHPSVAGTYLAACVLYATIFHQRPVGLGAADGLAADDVRLLQQVAASVLDDPARWGIRQAAS